VTANAATNAITRKDLAAGRYPDLSMEIPFDADPYAQDLVVSYWPSVRQVIRRSLAD